ncbi:hypothetical protein HPB51_022142 [Rhipicephalus microplus]|uniref:RNA polymerase II-associated protein 3 n=1 Tax=Rhipicephalus microplus TaxID=6941 RepID=A0A9J6ED08_RHIMP|nr:hypothetical protein HPB51_022142 [Rhipicephalus microplus]
MSVRSQLKKVVKNKLTVLGNRLFKDGRYDEAIESYGIGIECDPVNPVLYANRAMAFLRKNMLGAAEEDCCRALEALAAEDFRMVLSLEPNNKEARQHLTKLEKELKSGGGDTVATEPSSLAQSSNAKEPAARAEKPPKKGSATGKASLPIRAVTAVKVEPLSSPRNRRAAEKPLKRVPIHDVPGGTPLKKRWVAARKTHEPELPPPAPTSYQFQVDWKQLAPFPELRYKYLQSCDALKLQYSVLQLQSNRPEQIGTFFKESMETELFCDILCILENQFVRDGVDIHPILSSLPKVGRFSTLVMFLGSEDKKRLARLLAIASKVDPGLALHYGL